MLMGTLAYPFEAQEADTRKQKLTQTEFLDTRDIDCIEQPGLNARARFFARRHCLIVHVIVSALLAFPIALVVVMRARQIDDVVDYLIVTQFGLCSMLAFMTFWPLLSSMNRPAKPVDFAAAFAAACRVSRYICSTLSTELREHFKKIKLRNKILILILIIYHNTGELEQSFSSSS